jgi:hypothetical protein
VLRFLAPAGINGSEPLVLALPASDRVADFVQSITYFITTISEIEERHPVDVLDDILVFQSTGAAQASAVGG